MAEKQIGTLIDPKKKAEILQRIKDRKKPLFMQEKPEPEESLNYDEVRWSDKLTPKQRKEFLAFRITVSASFGELDVVKECIRAGVDPNLCCKSPTLSPLMYACTSGRIEIVKLLLDAGADVNAKTDDNKTALSFAMERGVPEVIDLLKKRGAME
jgi:hypothetical protein